LVTRGKQVESRHRGAACVVDVGGDIVGRWGDVDAPIFPRSAVKPLQALPLVESGAADRFAVSDAELALACASHAGTAEHVRAVALWLARLGLDGGALACGPHPPLAETAARELLLAGEPPSSLHNNCSGKHAGMLTVALDRGLPTGGYEHSGHPVQRAVGAALAETGGFDLDGAPVATDGCGVPTLAMPLRALALAFSRFGVPAGLGPVRAQACRRLAAAFIRHPRMISGDGRFDTTVNQATSGRVLVKGGAEGVAAACIPALGLGLAVKIDDGSKRAVEAAMAGLLIRFAGLDGAANARLVCYADTPITNTRGEAVGAVRCVADWDG
jgi:L-asparaginase II